MTIDSPGLKAVALAAALTAASAAYANDAALLTPLTANTSSPSNWRFVPGQAFNGVAGALDGVARLSYANAGGNWICSGSLLAGGQYVLTAAHCADDFSSMKVSFGWANGAVGVSRNVAVTGSYVNPRWNGDLDTGADIAVLKLDQAVTTIKGYKLSATNDVGKDYLMAGYGTSGLGGGDTEPNLGERAWGHYGYNSYDVDSKSFNEISNQVVDNWGYDPNYYAPGATYMSDYDDGSAAHNTLGRIAGVSGNGWRSGSGLGANEALAASGDSGGGDFIWNGSEWLLSGVHSWGFQGSEMCPNFNLSDCDASPGNPSGFGDLSGSTATYSHLAWINAVTAVPEPQTYAMMLSGLAMAGLIAGRRRQKQG
ncbi:PEP-CTERM sorting domain-containing protein [Duganella sp. BJB488]|uniref:trypsin-like serine protease n=1 Tax=unclassified Duganella TaxID=2636909 RepID=UPI000E3519A4|nr:MULTISPECIES: trypsin-like serine protease [unclassified Duganella]RFP09334.1 PEP-CTERM sorting domain-containing protein [Duganella sp. BJB475]RFP13222.1 PEP-CTERM sorting domain-containing protein [Duganella sp. BJB489]RFP17203.1 PEP-CTERM sorting domain-containing protein [Duganella sp. BJB488]RFP25370.1 PEP-CTERM sorting domain-containing protein [Duganella sp. BJB476]RFP31577.1 PEP-CTERM sorting domain-containing protein [Duganella sp. BJB480]